MACASGSPPPAARAVASRASNSASVLGAEFAARIGQARAHGSDAIRPAFGRRAAFGGRADGSPFDGVARHTSRAAHRLAPPVGVRTDFPRAVRRIDHTWIPLADGTRLAARIWLPEDAERDPVPAILEYLPYRKGDAFAPRDSYHHPYFAGYGYAGVRVDLRGTGDSDGIIEDEYLPQEQEDAIDVIAWLAEQPWCSGAVGMIGIPGAGSTGCRSPRAARRP